jgi:hypothetical protein
VLFPAAGALETAKLVFARIPYRFLQLFTLPRMACEADTYMTRKSLVDWLEADLGYGSGRNEAIF